MKLNLGCGGKVMSGYVNVDVNPRVPGVDVFHNLDEVPWPFESESAEEIRMEHVLEHLCDPNAAMREVHRILQAGGIVHIVVPHFLSPGAFVDPTHRRYFAHDTFFYYTGRGGYFDFRFSACTVRFVFKDRWGPLKGVFERLATRFPRIYEETPLRMFPAYLLDVTLVK